MGAFLVVDRYPVVSYFLDLIQVFKEVSIEHLIPIGAVKALDKCVPSNNYDTRMRSSSTERFRAIVTSV